MAAIFRPDVILKSLFSTLLNSCFHLKFFTVICCLTMLINATPHFLDSEPQLGEDEIMAAPDKRPARLSYFRSPYSSSRRRLPRLSNHRSPYSSPSWRRYGGGGRRGGSRFGGRRSAGNFRSNGFGGHGSSEWWRKKSFNNSRYPMPWESLPNTNCLRDFCTNNSDCCRRFSKCNKRAHVCYDCWYGHPCLQDYDCCENYPYCNRVLKTCGK